MISPKTDTKSLPISESVKWIGVIDYDIVTFDVVMETKYGTTYNSYLIRAEKPTIVEVSKEKFWPVYEAKIRSEIDPYKIEYIVLNHTEPDHSGNLMNLLAIAPNATVVGTGNAIRYLKDLFNCDFRHMIIKDGEELSLGNKTLKFISAPNLHWPDSMYTYLKEEKLLFTCDSFGCHYAHENMYDDQVGNFDDAFRYYFDVILKPYSKFLLKAIDKISGLDINSILPGHGPLLLKNWQRYVQWSKEIAEEYLKQPEQNNVFIAYVSAYHKTEAIAQAIARGIRENSDAVTEVMDIENATLGELDEHLTRAKGIVVGCPTINKNILLPVYKLFALINPIRDNNKVAGGFGSFGWSGEAQTLIKGGLTNLRLNYVGDGYFTKFTPSDSELNGAYEYGKAIATAMKENKPVSE